MKEMYLVVVRSQKRLDWGRKLVSNLVSGILGEGGGHLLTFELLGLVLRVEVEGGRGFDCAESAVFQLESGRGLIGPWGY